MWPVQPPFSQATDWQGPCKVPLGKKALVNRQELLKRKSPQKTKGYLPMRLYIYLGRVWQKLYKTLGRNTIRYHGGKTATAELKAWLQQFLPPYTVQALTTVEESRYTLTNWDQSQSWKICRDSTFSIRMLWNLSKQPLYLQRWAAGIAQKLPGRSKTHSRWGLNR